MRNSSIRERENNRMFRQLQIFMYQQYTTQIHASNLSLPLTPICLLRMNEIHQHASFLLIRNIFNPLGNEISARTHSSNSQEDIIRQEICSQPLPKQISKSLSLHGVGSFYCKHDLINVSISDFLFQIKTVDTLKIPILLQAGG